MRQIFLFLFCMLLLSSFVSGAQYTLDCSMSSYLGELSDPYHFVLDTDDTPTVDREKDLCDLTITDGKDTLTEIKEIEVSFTKNSNEISFTNIFDPIKGKLHGFDVEFPANTKISFSEDGAVVHFFEKGKGTLLRNGRGVRLTAEKEREFSFSLAPSYRTLSEREGSTNVDNPLIDITLFDDALDVSLAVNGDYEFMLNNYYLHLNNKDDVLGYDSTTENLELTLNEQENGCDNEREQTALYAHIGIIDDEEISSEYRFTSLGDTKFCNTFLTLLNANQKSYDKQFVVESGSDALALDFVVVGESSDDSDKDTDKTYSFLINSGDRLTFKKEEATTKEGTRRGAPQDSVEEESSFFSGILEIGAGDGSSVVPIQIAGQTQYAFSGSSLSPLSEESSFSFTLKDGETKVTDCVFYGSQEEDVALETLAFWCGEQESFFEMGHTEDLQGFEYSEDIWSCLNDYGSCFSSFAEVDLYPLEKYSVSPREGKIRLIPSAFEKYAVTPRKLTANKFYVGEGEYYLVKPDLGEVTFEKGSLILKMSGGEVKDTRLARSYSLEQGVDNYALRFDKGNELDSINCCPNPARKRNVGENLVYACTYDEPKFSLSDVDLVHGECFVYNMAVSALSGDSAIVAGSDGNTVTAEGTPAAVATALPSTSSANCEGYTINGNDGWMYRCENKNYYSCKKSDPSVRGGPYTTADPNHLLTKTVAEGGCNVAEKEDTSFKCGSCTLKWDKTYYGYSYTDTAKKSYTYYSSSLDSSISDYTFGDPIVGTELSQSFTCDGDTIYCSKESFSNILPNKQNSDTSYYVDQVCDRSSEGTQVCENTISYQCNNGNWNGVGSCTSEESFEEGDAEVCEENVENVNAAPSIEKPWYVKLVDRNAFLEKEEQKPMYRASSRASGCSIASRTAKTFRASFEKYDFSCDKSGLESCYSSASIYHDRCRMGWYTADVDREDEQYCCAQAEARAILCDDAYKLDCQSRNLPSSPGPLCEGEEEYDAGDVFEQSTTKVKAEVGCNGCRWDVQVQYDYVLLPANEEEPRSHLFFTTSIGGYYKDFSHVEIVYDNEMTGQQIYDEYCSVSSVVLYCSATSSTFAEVVKDTEDYSFTESFADNACKEYSSWTSYLGSYDPCA